MTLKCLAGLALVAALGATPAFAAGADGKWDCTVEDNGSVLGSIGLRGATYIFANPTGTSGQGSIAYQQGAADPIFVVLNGPLVAVGMLGGALDASDPSDPVLTLVDQLGNRVSCKPRA